MSLNIKDALLWASSYLKKKGVDSYKLDSEIILARLLLKERVYLYAHPEEIVKKEILREFQKQVRKRGNRLPLAYILNEKEFFGRDIYVEKGVFCPRPETEILVEEVLKTVPVEKSVKVFEIGLGTAAISVTIALALPKGEFFGCDISKKAISVAKKNIFRYKLEKRVYIFRANLLDAVKPVKFDVVISNPPYLSRRDYLEAEAEVRKEPKKALMAKDRGLLVIKKIIRLADNHLRSGGWIFIEIGDGQGGEVLKYAEKRGFKGVIVKDLAGKERVFKAEKL
ncbi:MAG: peptide chain release factor N(5)-glutamine methyltransferase [bacterium]